ncbi:enediyne antibiotic chromoprotein [Actinomadura rupiterrae]|uniref:enediyne antibiotic chromoprotein n=1 Tax=Actinomadura rupiterrae TaxID=559627 RepID=UPI0020A33065|nr:enediyne antibiotic chromoprotein [Actinomadura rupiterrae]MCP2336095.1 hypothetical protein [Actinomadura rupiterrae]
MFTKLVGASVLTLAVGAALSSPASAAVALTVTPSSGLSDGQVVQTSATGLTPGTTYRVGECAEVEPNTFACSFPDIVQGTADANGNFATPLTVRASFQGVKFDGTTWGPVDCKVQQCEIGIGDLNLDPGARTPISFQ